MSLGHLDSAGGTDHSTWSRERTHLARRATLRSWASLFDSLGQRRPSLHRALGLHHSEMPGCAFWSAPQIPHVLFNRAYVTHPDAVEPMTAHFRAAGATHFLLSMEPGVLDEVSARARSRLGLERFPRAWMEYGCSVPSEPLADLWSPDGLAIGTVGRGGAEEVGSLLTRCFGLPPEAAAVFSAAGGLAQWDVYACHDRRRLVGAGLAFHGAGVTYLFGAATDPDHRRKGIQRAVLQARLAAAQIRGTQLVTSETGVPVAGQPNPSGNNMIRLGLIPTCTIEHLCPAGARW